MHQRISAVGRYRAWKHTIDTYPPPGTLILSDGYDEDWIPPHVVDIHAVDSGALSAIFSISLATLTIEARSLEFWVSAAIHAITTLQRSIAAREGHRTVMDTLIPFVVILSKATL